MKIAWGVMILVILMIMTMKILTVYEGKHRIGISDSADWAEDIILPAASFSPDKQLMVVTWGNYLPQEVFDLFTEKYGTEIVTTEVTSNEEMLELLEKFPGKYDVLTPSDYMVTKMINEGLLRRLDHDKFSNIGRLDEDVRRAEYDRGLRFCVPLFRTSLGIGVNIKYVTGIPRDLEFIVEQIQNDYLAYRTGIVKEMRFAMGIALMYLGYSPNTINPAEIIEARDVLIRMVEKYGLILMGELNDDEALVSNDVLLSIVWNGTAAIALHENSEIRFLLPEGEVLVAIDSAVVSVKSKRVSTAELFINYMLIPEVAARMSNYNSNPNCVTASMPFVKRIIRNGPGFLFPIEENRRYLMDLGEKNTLYEDAWAKVLEAKTPDTLIKLPLPKGGLFQGGTQSSNFVKQSRDDLKTHKSDNQ